MLNKPVDLIEEHPKKKLSELGIYQTKSDLNIQARHSRV